MIKFAFIVLLAMGMQSCFTTFLWGGEVHTKRDEVTGDREPKPQFELTDEEEGFPSLGVICYRILLTPVAILLDCVTYPVQAFVHGWDQED